MGTSTYHGRDIDSMGCHAVEPDDTDQSQLGPLEDAREMEHPDPTHEHRARSLVERLRLLFRHLPLVVYLVSTHATARKDNARQWYEFGRHVRWLSALLLMWLSLT